MYSCSAWLRQSEYSVIFTEIRDWQELLEAWKLTNSRHVCRSLTPPFPLWLSLFLPHYGLKLVSSLCMSFSICYFLCHCMPLPSVTWTHTIHDTDKPQEDFHLAYEEICTFQYKIKAKEIACNSRVVVISCGQLANTGTAENTHPASPSQCLHLNSSNTTNHQIPTMTKRDIYLELCSPRNTDSAKDLQYLVCVCHYR